MLRRSLMATSLAIAMSFAPSSQALADTWGPQRSVAAWSWSSRQAFAVTGSGDLVALTSSDFAGGSFATDHGPYQGVFVRSSSDKGQSWSAPVRVSQAKRQAERGALAASGSSLYAAWVTQKSYDHYDPAQPRTLWFRANTGGGWGATIQLTKSKGRVDAPSVAASG